MDKKLFGKCDYDQLKKNYREALKDEGFKDVVSKLDLDDDVLMKYTSKLETSTSEQNNCKSCKGLYSCKNKINGCVYSPVTLDKERLQFEYVACKYKNRQLEEEKLSCDYYEMPSSLKKASMKDIKLDDKKRVDTIKWLKNFYDTYEDEPHQKGLYLHGSFGSGKTYLVCAMLNELAKKKIDICVAYYPELLRSLKDSFEKDFASRIDKLKKVSILFLDDIGAEAVTQWARDEVLGTVLQYRMDASLPTFFTSNLTIDELETHLSSTKNGVEQVKARRIIERIKQLTIPLELVSTNRRQ